MYPVLFEIGDFSVYTYSVCIAVGLILTAVCFNLLSKKLKMSNSAYDFFALMAIISILVGFIFAYLFQDFYHYLDKGYFTLAKDIKKWLNGGEFQLSGGITFMGGLIGGAGCFILGTVIKRDKNIWKEFPLLMDIAAPCILLAHGCGRMGCFFGGCCYGKPTDGIFGVIFPGHSEAVHPTQLYEAAFCFIAFGILLAVLLLSKKRGYLISVYGISYSIFRFIVENYRGDERNGANIGLSPSQIQSFVFIAISLTYLAFWIYMQMRAHKQSVVIQNNGENK